MEGKLDKDGDLWVMGKEKYHRKSCPFTSDSTCGTWCALFGEPKYTNLTGTYKKIFLELCQKTLSFEEFTDERDY